MVSLPWLPKTLPVTVAVVLQRDAVLAELTFTLPADERGIDGIVSSPSPPLTSTLTEELSTRIVSLPRPPSTLFPTVLRSGP